MINIGGYKDKEEVNSQAWLRPLGYERFDSEELVVPAARAPLLRLRSQPTTVNIILITDL